MKFKNCLAYHLTTPLNNPQIIIDALKSMAFQPMDEKTLLTFGSVPPLAYFENGVPMGDQRLVLSYKNIVIFRITKAAKQIPISVLDYEVSKEIEAYKERTREEQAPLDFIEQTRERLRYFLAKGAPVEIENYYGAFDFANQLFYSFNSSESYANTMINLLKKAVDDVSEEEARVRFITLKNYSGGEGFTDELTALMIGPYLRTVPDAEPDPAILEHSPHLNAEKLSNALLGTNAVLKEGARQIILKNEHLQSDVNRLRLAKSRLMVEKMEICAMAGEASSDPENPNPRHMACSAEFSKNGGIHNLSPSHTVEETIFNEIEAETRAEVDLIVFAFCVRTFLEAVLPAFWHPLNIHLKRNE
ncbi:recombination-associated protein RdgC [Vibrio cholerae]|nr:recombination-associated protein RdgC [Vibrio cholerae]